MLKIDINDIDVTKLDVYRQDILDGKYVEDYIHWYTYETFKDEVLRPCKPMYIKYIDCKDEDLADVLRVTSNSDMCCMPNALAASCRIELDDVTEYDIVTTCLALSAKYEVTVYDYKLVIN